MTPSKNRLFEEHLIRAEAYGKAAWQTTHGCGFGEENHDYIKLLLGSAGRSKNITGPKMVSQEHEFRSSHGFSGLVLYHKELGAID